MGWNVISEVNNVGALMRSYVHNPQGFGRATLAHVDGSNPAVGAYRYYHHDHLGSTRSVFDQNKNLAAAYRYTPYGDILASTNTAATTHLYTGHDWNPATATYFAPYRHYSPRTARWLTRDPLGMVDGPNVYAYVTGNAVNHVDVLGLSIFTDFFWKPDWDNWPQPPPTDRTVEECKEICDRTDDNMKAVHYVLGGAMVARCYSLPSNKARLACLAVAGAAMRQLLRERRKAHKRCYERCECDPNTPWWKL